MLVTELVWCTLADFLECSLQSLQNMSTTLWNYKDHTIVSLIYMKDINDLYYFEGQEWCTIYCGGPNADCALKDLIDIHYSFMYLTDVHYTLNE